MRHHRRGPYNRRVDLSRQRRLHLQWRIVERDFEVDIGGAFELLEVQVGYGRPPRDADADLSGMRFGIDEKFFCRLPSRVGSRHQDVWLVDELGHGHVGIRTGISLYRHVRLDCQVARRAQPEHVTVGLRAKRLGDGERA